MGEKQLTLRGLITTLEALAKAHGDAAKVDFQHKWASGRTTIGHITGYTASGITETVLSPRIRFTLNHARGDLVE